MKNKGKVFQCQRVKLHTCYLWERNLESSRGKKTGATSQFRGGKTGEGSRDKENHHERREPGRRGGGGGEKEREIEKDNTLQNQREA